MEAMKEERDLEQETAQFAQKHPEVEELPDQVADAWANGTELTAAWEEQAAQAAREDKIHRQNQEAAYRAPVGAVSGQGGVQKAPKDDFLSGLELDQW